MNDELYIQVKVGDLSPEDGLKGMTDGMLIDRPDQTEWNNKIIMPEFSKKAFALLRVDRKYKSLIDSFLVRDGELKRKGSFELDVISKLVSSDLASKWRGDDSVDVIDARSWKLEDHIKLSRDRVIEPRDIKIDLNLVTQGSYDIGSGGIYDYLTLAAADLDTAGMDGDLTFTFQTAVTETAGASFAAINGGFKLTIDSSVNTTDVLTGNIWTINHGVDAILNTQAGGGDFEFKNMSVIRSIAGGAFNGILNLASATLTTSVHNCFMKGLGSGIAVFEAGNVTNCYLVAARDFDTGILPNTPGNTAENCLFEGNITFGVRNNSQVNTLRNIVCFNNGIDFGTTTNATGLYLGSSDATAFGTAPQTNLTPANEIILNDALATYGRPIDLATIYNSGTTPTLSSADMAGDTWSSPLPIGIFMLAGGVAGPPLGSLSLLGVGK